MHRGYAAVLENERDQLARQTFAIARDSVNQFRRHLSRGGQALEQFDKLKGGLEHLAGPGRADLAKKIEAAREEGDLRENGGYHAAKEEQGKQEARIRQLTQLLENATVGEAPSDNGVVEPGMVVTVELCATYELTRITSAESAIANR